MRFTNCRNLRLRLQPCCKITNKSCNAMKKICKPNFAAPRAIVMRLRSYAIWLQHKVSYCGACSACYSRSRSVLGSHRMNRHNQTAIVKETYRKLWKDWYASCTPVRALVQVDLSDECSRYNHSHNLIIIAIAEGNLDDHDILDLSAWPIWKVELVHETLHEWQAKAPCIVTCEAEALFLKSTAW